MLQKLTRAVKLTAFSSGGSEGTWDSVNDDIVNWALLGLKNKKAAGPDGLPAEVLKNEVCITFFQNLFPSCLKSVSLQCGDMELLFQSQRIAQVILESH